MIMWFLYILGAIIALVIHVLICNRFGNIAAQKGYNDSVYFWICFFLGITGYIMVAALPDLTTTYILKGQNDLTNSPSESLHMPASTSKAGQDNSWSCTCGCENANHITICPCGINKRDIVK